MIKFNLNGKEKTFTGDENLSLLKYLRQIEEITSVKEGCFGQGACGACLVEVNQKPALSCLVPMKRLNNADIVTIEGFDPIIRKALGRAFVKTGALQCGFCAPGFLCASKILLEKNPDPDVDEIVEALKLNLCRCTGYIKIVEGVKLAARSLREKKEIDLPYTGTIGEAHCKYMGYERATGKTLFIDDIKIDGLLYSALKFSDHPRAKIIEIDISKAADLAGVIKIFTASDIPGKRHTGVISDDWPLMIKKGETTRYIGDVLAGVVAKTEETAKKAAALIEVKYEVLQPVTDMLKAEESDIKIHADGNLLSETVIKRGDNSDEVISGSAYKEEAIYTTHMVEHGFIETEAAIAVPLEDGGIKLHVQTQGIYDDRQSVSEILGIEEEKVRIILEPTGGAFGGKEDITVQGHVALFSFILKRPVKLRLSREDSIRMHPKRHPMHLKYTVSCDSKGMLTALKARITGDTGAYASLGKEVLVRSAMHATGAYYVPNVDIISKAVYTNNIPCGV